MPPSFKFLFRRLQHIVCQKLVLIIRRKPLVYTGIQVIPIKLLQSVISSFLIFTIWQMVEPTMMNSALYINGRATLAQCFISQENLVYLCRGEVLSQTLVCQSKKHSQDCSVLYCHSSTLSLIRQSGVASITHEHRTILCCVSFSRNWPQNVCKSHLCVVLHLAMCQAHDGASVSTSAPRARKSTFCQSYN